MAFFDVCFVIYIFHNKCWLYKSAWYFFIGFLTLNNFTFSLLHLSWNKSLFFLVAWDAFFGGFSLSTADFEKEKKKLEI